MSPVIEGPIPTTSKRFTHIWNFFKIALAIFLVGFILSKTDLQQLRSLGGQIVYSWLGARFLFFCFMLGSKTFQYWILLEKKIPYSRLLGIVVMQNALSNFVTNAAGIASYMTMLRAEAGIKLGRAGISFALTKVGDLFSMCFFLILSAFFLWNQMGGLRGLVIVLVVGVFLLLFVVFTAILFRQRFISVLQTVLVWFHLDRIGLVDRGYQTLLAISMQDIQVIIRVLVRSMGLSLVYMCVTLALYYSGFRMFNLSIPFWVIIFVAVIVQLLSVVPIQVLGGLGITEVTSLYLYGLFGIAQESIAAPLVGLRMIYYLMNLIVLLYLPMELFLFRQKPRTNGGSG